MSDIAEWLEGLGLGKYVPAFAEQEVDLTDLPELSEADLKEMGLPLGPRRRILRAVLETAAVSRAAGAPATAGSGRIEGERRQLTVMFVDLVGSTALSERLDPEDLAVVLNLFKRTCAAAIAQFDGHVAQYLGDGILVYFGYPHAHEDDAARAIHAALRIVEMLPAIETQERLHARIGIATGLVVIGDMRGAGVSGEGTVLGETPNLAARLQALADPDCIVVAPATRRLAGNAFDYAERGSFALKGFSGEVPVCQVTGVRSESRFMAAHDVPPGRMVGRVDELRLLQNRWAEARQGAAQVVLVSGDAGIGKSCLVESLCQELRDEPHIALRYQCSPYHDSSTLYPVIRQLERAAQFGAADSDADKLDKLAAVLEDPSGTTLQLAAELLSLPSDQLDLDPRQRKERTLDMLIDQLAAQTARCPVLMVFEDVHWIDPTTRLLVERIIERLSAAPVLIVMTFRPEFDVDWPTMPCVARLALERLREADVASIVQQVAEGRSLPSEIHELIAAKSAGVPLYVEEVTKHILESGMLQETRAYTLAGPLPGLAVPSSLQDLLMARLDGLGSAKQVAQAAAAVGRHFTLALMTAVLPFSQTVLRAALDRLIAAEIIAPAGDGSGEAYSYRHALIQDTAYNSLLHSDRKGLHGRIAEALRQQMPQIEETEPEFLAHHYMMAAQIDRAIAYWHMAGRRAVERSANVEAVTHLTKALEHLETLPPGDERDRQEIDIQVLRAGVLRSTVGIAADETGEVYSRILHLCNRVGEAAPPFPLLNGLYAFHLVRAEYNLARDTAGKLLAFAERSGATEHTMVGHRAMGAVLLHIGELPLARDHLQQAFELYDPARHASLAYVYGTDHAAITSSFLGIATWLLGHPDEALEIQQQALASAETLEHAHSVAQVLTYLCLLRLLRREESLVLECADRLSRLSAKHAFPFMEMTANFWRSWAAASLHPTAETIGQVRQAADVWWSSGAGNYKPFFLTLIAELMGRMGLTDVPLDLLRAARQYQDETNEGWAEAEMHRVEGDLRRADPQRAEECYQRALGVARRQGVAMFELRAAVRLARLWRRQGRDAAAAALVVPLCARFDEVPETMDLVEAGRIARSIA